MRAMRGNRTLLVRERARRTRAHVEMLPMRICRESRLPLGRMLHVRLYHSFGGLRLSLPLPKGVRGCDGRGDE